MISSICDDIITLLICLFFDLNVGIGQNGRQIRNQRTRFTARKNSHSPYRHYVRRCPSFPKTTPPTSSGWGHGFFLIVPTKNHASEAQEKRRRREAQRQGHHPPPRRRVPEGIWPSLALPGAHRDCCRGPRQRPRGPQDSVRRP